MSDDTAQCTKIAAILMALEQGKLAKNDGKSLEAFLESYTPQDPEDEQGSDDDDSDSNERLAKSLIFTSFSTARQRVAFSADLFRHTIYFPGIPITVNVILQISFSAFAWSVNYRTNVPLVALYSY